MSSAHEGSAMLLEAREVVAGYRLAEVLHGVDLTVTRGQAVGVVGPNGAGKSTLLKVLAGVLPLRRGTLSLLGERIDRQSAAARVRRGLALVPEGRQVFAQLSVAENLWLGGFGAPTTRKEMADAVNDIFPRLAERQRQLAGTLSGGEQQMLALARGLMARPQLLLIDEPSLGLAPVLVDSLIDQLKRIRTDMGVSMLIAEQGVNLATEICDRIHVLAGGRSVAEVGAGVSESDLLALYMGSSPTGQLPDGQPGSQAIEEARTS